jgi:DNA ligase-associated metallophosphoesterase
VSHTARPEGTVPLGLAGRALLLDPAPAVVVDGHVIVADVHLDKAVTFQRAGIALPLGDEARDLARLATLLERHHSRSLIVLGDLVHAPPRRDGPTERAVLDWCAAHPHVTVTVVLGNHDRDAAERLAHWPVRWVPEPFALGPLTLRHAPAADGGAPELAGHLHPVLRLSEGRRDSARVPVFWQRPRGIVLPAFGSFTGGHAVDLAAGEFAWPAADGVVLGPVAGPRRGS